VNFPARLRQIELPEKSGTPGTLGWQDQVNSELDALKNRGTVDALWRRDPSAWIAPSTGGAPAEEATGWLDLPDRIANLVDELTSFADEVRNDGFTDLVLLGMGGSSLGPLVLGRVFGTSPGYLRLHVLDSTMPGQITAVENRIDLHRTLFLISSKSGTTIEPLSVAAYFRGRLERTGIDNPDVRFIAATDPGSSLESMANERGFRRVFNTPVDVGGRFSVLSRFGLLPAALIGVDLSILLGPAVAMAAACRASDDLTTNPGAQLGAVLGGLAAAGRDKVTIVTSPQLSSIGLWVEQLLAESTGKSGRGLVPVADEPLYGVSEYGDDRNFVYIRIAGDDNARTDDHMAALEYAGRPVTRIELGNSYDLGAEFFRWEFAVAVAATAISVYPFDQPDVESGKVFTRNLLESPDEAGQTLPNAFDMDELVKLVRGARPGDYVAILGYIPESPEADSAVSELRAAITRRTGIATTFGYGPRYLHSTGQLHKGGPDGVIGLALVAGNEDALAASRADSGSETEMAYGFESLFVAQVLGDLEALHAKAHRNTMAVLETPYEKAIQNITESFNESP
jgi:glucose-6-phosphate isomerase/transaldolase/glucose-6-phosphate isomerase